MVKWRKWVRPGPAGKLNTQGRAANAIMYSTVASANANVKGTVLTITLMMHHNVNERRGRMRGARPGGFGWGPEAR